METKSVFQRTLAAVLTLGALVALPVGASVAAPVDIPPDGRPGNGPPDQIKPGALKLELEYEAVPDEVTVPGGEVEFTLRVKNEAKTPVQIISITESLVEGNLVPDGLLLPAQEEWSTPIKREVSGEAGDAVHSIVTVVAQRGKGIQVPFQVRATVKIKAADSDEDDEPPVLVQATIGDRVWLDANNDGVQTEGEGGVAGVRIRLFAVAGDKLLEEVESGANGDYAFEGEFPEKVYLKVSPLKKYTITAWQVGKDRAIDSDIDPATGKSIEIQLSATESKQLQWDVGLVEQSAEEMGPGVAGPGFWRNHLEAWPVDELVIAGVTYTKAEAAAKMINGADKRRTLFRSLVAARLNVLAGAEDSCILETLEEADAWLMADHAKEEVRGSNPAWSELGKTLNETLEQYNEGLLCAPKRHESLTPVSLRPERMRKADGKAKELQLRVCTEKGRTVILQKSTDMETWIDVAVLENIFGISEVLSKEPESTEVCFYRVVFPKGPAQAPKQGPASRSPFMVVGNDQQVELDGITYEGSLFIAGNNNTVVGEGAGTRIAGDLIITGNRNKVSDLQVLGKVVLLGNENEVDVDADEAVEDEGDGNTGA
ncbi:MAG: SdrD B-like domain-containing protein [Verrucomicrobiia bacterium]